MSEAILRADVIIAGISLGTVSPYMAFTPRVWWDILM
jgi:hypothetical protein